MHNRILSSRNVLWFFWFLVTLFGSGIASLTVSWGISGLLIGIGQWAILRTRLHKTWLWIPATTLGVPLGLLIGLIDLIALSWTIDFQSAWLSLLLMASLAGAIIGALQWVALYKKVAGAEKWVFISALSWGMGISLALYRTADSGNADVEFGILVGMVVGIISGAFVESTLINPDRGHENKPFPTKQAS